VFYDELRSFSTTVIFNIELPFIDRDF
jgi:hypothetical protein